MAMTEEQLLSQLKDIAEPATIGWWPLASGWWGLAVLLLVLLTTAVALLCWRHRRNRFRRQALAELHQLGQSFQQHRNARDYLDDLNALLKRVAILRFGRDQVASLHGRRWCEFLTSRAKGVNFLQAPGELLGEGLYRPLGEIPATELQQQVATWIRRCP